MTINTAPSFALGDGKTNSAFSTDGYTGSHAYAVALQADGRILVGGNASVGSGRDFAVARYNTDGSLDTSFDGDGRVTTEVGANNNDSAVRSIFVLDDGSILAAGSGSGATPFALVRYHADGSLDTGFDTDGIATTDIGVYDEATSATLQADGRILVAGKSSPGYGSGNSEEFTLLRYNSDGSLDTTFGGDGIVTTDIGAYVDRANGVVVQADGRIVVAGIGNTGTGGSDNTGRNNDFALVRYNADGSLDTTFGGDGIVTTAIDASNDGANAIVLQPDGRMLVAGSSHNGTNYDFALARYNADGSLDTSFGGDGIVTTGIGGNDNAYKLTLLADGRILAVGDAGNLGSNPYTDTYSHGNSSIALVMYNADGSLDTGFGTNGIATAYIDLYNVAYDVAVQADGRIVVAADARDRFALLRFNADGSLDSRFDPVNTLDGASGCDEDGVAVLDGNVQIYDAELFASGNYAGASLTLVRHGGANAEDGFARTGTALGVLTEGGNLTLSGTTVGTVTTNSGGTLVLSFNGNATPTLVNSVLQQVGYRPVSDTPPASVQIDWSFNDGNAGAQGEGGAAAVTGSSTVSITAVNDTPRLTGTATTLAAGSEDTPYIVTAAQLLAGWSDPESDALSVMRSFYTYVDNAGGTHSVFSNIGVDHGTVVANNDGTYTVTPATDYNGPLVLSYGVSDQPGSDALPQGSYGVFGTSTTLNFNVAAVNDAPAAPHANIIPRQIALAGQAYSYAVGSNVVFTDIDGDTLSYSATQADGSPLPSGLSFDAGTRSFSGSDIAAGDYTIRLIAGDGALSSYVGFNLAVKAAQVEGSSGIYNGSAAAELVVGSTAADVMAGGGGNDTYVVDHARDSITESLSGGSADEVRAGVSYTLGGNIENLTLTGSGNINGTGNAGVNVLRGNGGNNVLDGRGGVDSYLGGEGNDTYVIDSATETDIAEYANEGSDLVQVNVAVANGGYALGDNLENATILSAVAYNLTGNALDNALTGNGAANLLDGGAGADTLTGGGGNDIYVVDAAGDVVTEAPAGGTDTVRSAVARTLGGNFENLTLTGSAAINGTGNAVANALTGNAGANVLSGEAGNDSLDGGAGADTLDGGTGNDLYTVDNTGDVVTESSTLATEVDLVQASASFTLGSNLENLTLTGSGDIDGTGNGQANTILGNAGANTLDGQAGADNLRGGAGNDTYRVDIRSAGQGAAMTVALQDSVTESPGAGTDTLALRGTAALTGARTLTLLPNVENLDVSGTGSTWFNLNGSVAANILVGNGAANIIDGGSGADTLRGGAGNDSYLLDNVGDVVDESDGQGGDAGGTDLLRIRLAAANCTTTLSAYVENAILISGVAGNLTGNAQNNTLTGNAAANVLDGGAGADTLVGGVGNDSYVVDNPGDVVTELAAGGNDTVRASFTWTLADKPNLENLILTGVADVNATGNVLGNVLTGNAGANALDGGAGNDTLDGGAGADEMIGGDGNDIYIVDAAGDTVTEESAVATQIDQVRAGVGFTLGANVENLTLTGSADIDGSGNGLANVITGNAGANVLDGGAGRDVLSGGNGNDSYVVDLFKSTSNVVSLHDTVTETAAVGSGTDTLTIRNGNAIALASAFTVTAPANVENVDLSASGSLLLNANGSAAANRLTGNAGNNTLRGGAGNDIYVAGLGADTVNDAIVGAAGTAQGGTDELHLRVDQMAGAISSLDFADLRFSRSGANLRIDIGTAGSVTVQGMNATASMVEVLRLFDADGNNVLGANAGVSLQSVYAHASSTTAAALTLGAVGTNGWLAVA